jgi:putative ABC transport system permease protein
MTFLYALVVRVLLPRSARQHAAAMVETAASLSRDARARGVSAYLRYWFREFHSLGAASWTEHPRRRALPMFSTVFQDVRYAFRLLVRTPGVTIIALLTLALGIGANTAIFSIVDGVLLRPLSYADPDRLVLIQQLDATDPEVVSRTTPGTFYDVQQSSRSFDELAAYQAVSKTLTGKGDPERIDGVLSAGSILSVLGVQPQLGRVQTADDDRIGAARTVVLSDRLWQRLFGGRGDALGQTLVLDGEPHEVIGVMPKGFTFPDVGPDFWAPMQMTAKERASRTESFLLVLGRLRGGVSADAARSDLEIVMSRLRREFPLENANALLGAEPLRESVIADVSRLLWILMASVSCVLLIGCANLANLLLARATRRRQEIALRQAIGASRSRVVRQLLVESLVLAMLGGFAGVLTGHLFLDALVAWLPAGIPRIASATIDGRVMFFTIAVSAITGIIFGLAPAVQATRGEAATLIRGDMRTSTSRSTVRSALVVAEVAIAVLLLAGAGLLIRSFVRLQQVDPGFSADHVLTFNLRLEGPDYRDAPGRVRTVNQIVERLRVLPGVGAASASSYVPVTGLGTAAWFNIASRPVPPGATPPSTPYRVITPEYFRVMQIPLLRGRLLTEADGLEGTPSVVISESLARRFWRSPADGDPIGAQVWLGPPDNRFARGTVVGIVKDVKLGALAGDLTDAVYGVTSLMPFWRAFTFSVRTSGDPLSVAAEARQVVRELAPSIAVTAMQPMTDIVRRSAAPARASMLLLVLFAAIAAAMAAIGVFGVMSYVVNLRMRELGIRLALGARGADLQRMVLTDGLKQALAGVLLGLVASVWLTRSMRALLYGVDPGDPLTLAAVAGLLLATTVLACFVPARRATQIDPLSILRTE